jgi:hypothetical protein
MDLLSELRNILPDEESVRADGGRSSATGAVCSPTTIRVPRRRRLPEKQGRGDKGPGPAPAGGYARRAQRAAGGAPEGGARLLLLLMRYKAARRPKGVLNPGKLFLD